MFSASVFDVLCLSQVCFNHTYNIIFVAWSVCDCFHHSVCILETKVPHSIQSKVCFVTL